MRSINTSLIALLPVAGLLFVGAGLLGVGTLKDLALVLFVGLAAGAYSSIFLATPIVCELKEREPKYAALAKRVAQRRAAEAGRGRRRPAAGSGPAPHRRDRGHPDRAGRGRPAAPAEDDEGPGAERAGAGGAGRRAPTPAGRAAAGAGSSAPRPGARPKRPAQKRGGGGRPSAKKRR